MVFELGVPFQTADDDAGPRQQPQLMNAERFGLILSRRLVSSLTIVELGTRPLPASKSPRRCSARHVAGVLLLLTLRTMPKIMDKRPPEATSSTVSPLHGIKEPAKRVFMGLLHRLWMGMERNGEQER